MWTEYMSTDAGAPVYNGLAGSKITVLKAILQTGYGALPAAGWAEPFGAPVGNIAMLRPNGGLLRPYMRIDDAAARAAPFNNGCEARVRCHEAATGLSAGLAGHFPTVAQAANGIIVRKSETADATARPWIAFADDRTIWFFAQTGDYGAAWSGWVAGEYFSRKPTPDAYNGIMIGRVVEQIAATPTALPNQETLPLLSGVGAVTAGHFICRSFTEAAQSAVNCGKHGAGEHSAVGLVGLGMWPNPVDDATDLDNVRIHEIATPLMIRRGRLRGFWHLLHPAASFNHLDTFAGTGALAGKSFRVIKPVPDNLGAFVMERSNTVETN